MLKAQRSQIIQVFTNYVEKIRYKFKNQTFMKQSRVFFLFSHRRYLADHTSHTTALWIVVEQKYKVPYNGNIQVPKLIEAQNISTQLLCTIH